MKSLGWAVLAVAAAAFAAAPSVAQSDDPYAACAATADDPARLACFDTTYARERDSRAERLEERRERSAEEFGLSAVQVRERDQGGADTETVSGTGADGDVESLSSEVADVFTNASGRSMVLLANGQLWTSLSGSTFRGTVKPEWRVTVTKSWSGGYRMRFEGKTGFLSVKRLR